MPVSGNTAGGTKEFAAKCPFCAAENRIGFVRPDGGVCTTTLIAWSPSVDPETGEIDRRDPNTVTSYESCTNGHCWNKSTTMGKTTYSPSLPSLGSEIEGDSNAR